MLASFAARAVVAQDYVPTGAGNGTMPFGPSGAPGPTNFDNGYNAVPGPPTRPTQVVRPESFPGGTPAPAVNSQPAAAYSQPEQYPTTSPTQYPMVSASRPVPPYAAPGQPVPPPEVLKPCEGAQVISRVGAEVILTSDIFIGVPELLSRNKDKFSPEQLEMQHKMVVQELTAGIRQLLDHINEPDAGSFVDAQRRAIIQQLLRQQVETKLIYQDFRRMIPSENMPNIEQSLTRQFEQTELKKLLKRENVDSNQDLEWRLRAKGTSLEREKRIFMEQVIRQQWMREQIKVDQEVTHEQMLAYYKAHLAEFEKPARARWEELMVSFSKYPSKEAAYATLAQMGNRVLGGAAWAEVAKAQSDGPSSSDGGRRDWTTKGSLVSEVLDRNLFGLPVGQLSPILEGTTGYHIIRATERQEQSCTPFSEVQKEVREKIHQERVRKMYAAYVVKIQKQFPIWTIFDSVEKKAAPVEEPSRY